MYASDYRRIAREKLGGKWGVSIGAALVAAIFGGLILGRNVSFDFRLDFRLSPELLEHFPLEVMPLFIQITTIGSLLSLIHFILGGPVRQGYCQFLLDQHDGRELRVKTLFSKFDRFGDGFVLMLLEGIFIGLWTLLFVIPGIIAGLRYAMAPYIMVEHPGMGAREAIQSSCVMMDGNKGRLFCLQLSFIGWGILSVMTCGIGFLWLNPYMNAAMTAFYREISKEVV